MINIKRNVVISTLIAFNILGILLTKPTIAQNKNYCNNTKPITSFELENAWVYICPEQDDLFYVKVDKLNKNTSIKLPAFGGFYTYTGVEGDITSEDRILYNIGPYELSIIDTGIITHTEPVIQTIDGETETIIQVLSGELETKAEAMCEANVPIRIFETDNAWVYICIDGSDSETSIDLTLIHVPKTNPNNKIKLPAELISQWRYQAKNKDNESYIIGTKNLEIWQQNNQISLEAVHNVYLKAPSSNQIIRD